MTGALSYCGEQVRRHDPDRFLTCLFAPAARREALFALYAFNHEIAKTRETVREPMMGRIRLQWWREAIAELYQGQVRAHLVVQALAGVLPERVDQATAQALIEARELDLEPDAPATGSELIRYTLATGGGLMKMAALILGMEDAALLQSADDRGEAAALAGLLRAVPHHAAEGKVYLPADLLRQMGIDPTRLNGRVKPRGLDVVCALMAEEAARLLNAWPARIERRHIAAFLPAALARVHLKRLAQCAHDPFDERNAAPYALKPLVMAKAWAAGRV